MPTYTVTGMSYPLSRIMSTGTAGYGVFALVKPEHLGSALKADKAEMPGYDLLARTYGVRDTAIGAVGMFGRSRKTVRAAMVLRIAMDLGDAAVLSRKVDDEDVRKKILAITLGWAGLNALALLVDSAGADD